MRHVSYTYFIKSDLGQRYFQKIFLTGSYGGGGGVLSDNNLRLPFGPTIMQWNKVCEPATKLRIFNGIMPEDLFRNTTNRES